MKKLVKLGSDFLGLVNICGLSVALRWIVHVLLCVPSILKKGDLQAADKAMGIGPFEVKLKKYNCTFKIMGTGAISGIREMYVRDTYLHDGWLTIKPNDTVLDLGANMGNFTNFHQFGISFRSNC